MPLLRYLVRPPPRAGEVTVAPGLTVDPEACVRRTPIGLADGLGRPPSIRPDVRDDSIFFQGTVRPVQRLIEREQEDFEPARGALEESKTVRAAPAR